MILKALNYISFLVLIFGFFYGTYHFGVMKGKQQERSQINNVVLNEAKENENFGGARNHSEPLHPPHPYRVSESQQRRKK